MNCAVHKTFGLLRPGIMWVSKGCGGLFRVWRDGFDEHNSGCYCVSADNDYKECLIEYTTAPMLSAHNASGVLQSRSVPTRDGQQSSGNVRIRTGQRYRSQGWFSTVAAKPRDWWMHAAADQLVPRKEAWLGDPRLNVVFYKFAKRLAATPCKRCPELAKSALAGRELALEWKWLWSVDWRPLLRLAAASSCPWCSRAEKLSGSRLARLFHVFQLLGKRLAQLRSSRAGSGGCTGSSA